MNRFGCFIISAALGLTCGDAFAVDSCTKITATGHPNYPVIAFRDGEQYRRRRARPRRGRGQEPESAA